MLLRLLLLNLCLLLRLHLLDGRRLLLVLGELADGIDKGLHCLLLRGLLGVRLTLHLALGLATVLVDALADIALQVALGTSRLRLTIYPALNDLISSKLTTGCRLALNALLHIDWLRGGSIHYDRLRRGRLGILRVLVRLYGLTLNLGSRCLELHGLAGLLRLVRLRLWLGLLLLLLLLVILLLLLSCHLCDQLKHLILHRSVLLRRLLSLLRSSALRLILLLLILG